MTAFSYSLYVVAAIAVPEKDNNISILNTRAVIFFFIFSPFVDIIFSTIICSLLVAFLNYIIKKILINLFFQYFTKLLILGTILSIISSIMSIVIFSVCTLPHLNSVLHSSKYFTATFLKLLFYSLSKTIFNLIRCYN